MSVRGFRRGRRSGNMVGWELGEEEVEGIAGGGGVRGWAMGR